MMKKMLIPVFMLAFVLLAQPARAEVVVLIHGYLSGAGSWDGSGVTSTLQQQGWQRAGVYIAGPYGVQFLPAQGARAEHKFYAVDLPSEAPVLVQVYQLHQILEAIKRAHSGEALVLVGHSAGGVVARAALVRGDARNVMALVTIASPHLGTERAEQALDATDIPFPFSMVTDILGGDTYDTAMRSRGLYVDLIRPQPGSLLYWLNAQPHPDIKYFSIVRGQSADGWGDYVVPAYSQDMNNVPVLRGRSSLITVPGSHALEPVDGGILARVLADLS
jgi:pimeloyl-ACP methyl ester carboxylesterase